MENENNEREFVDGEEELRLENEILKLKMMAERGAWFSESSEDLPLDVETQFLRNVQLFEDSFDKAEEVTIYECIGKPQYKDANELTEEGVKQETKRLLELLHSKNIILDVLGEYDLPVIYRFITDELFGKKIREINIPGYMQHFTYEEFYPNHALDIGNTAQRFFNDWFEKGFNEYSLELADPFITAEGKIYTKEDILQKLNNCLVNYKRFFNIKFKASDISFEWDDQKGTGIGHAQAGISYDAEIENGESIHIEGSYKLYMTNEYGLWQIFYFVFPGFSW